MQELALGQLQMTLYDAEERWYLSRFNFCRSGHHNVTTHSAAVAALQHTRLQQPLRRTHAFVFHYKRTRFFPIANSLKLVKKRAAALQCSVHEVVAVSVVIAMPGVSSHSAVEQLDARLYR